MDFRKITRKEEFQFSQEVAEDQLETLFRHYEIYEDEMGTEAEKQLFRMSYPKLVVAIRRGRLQILKEDDKLVIEQIVGKGDGPPIIYKELSGSARIQDASSGEMGESMEVARNKRVYSLMGSLSGLGMSAMINLKGNDLSIMECLGFLFLST